MPEPTPVWLVLAIESTRYQMTAATTKGYVALWTAERQEEVPQPDRRRVGVDAPCLSLPRRRLPGPRRPVEAGIEYLKRSTRLKFRQIDIERVCDFLGNMPDQKCKELLGKLVKTGLKQHPCSTALNFEAGIVALAK